MSTPQKSLPYISKQGDKRKRDEDESEIQAKRQDDGGKTRAMKGYFQRFLDAYDGKSAEYLGNDHPMKSPECNKKDPFQASKAVIIISSKKSSTIAPVNSTEGAMKFKYNAFSQNPQLEIRLGKMAANTSSTASQIEEFKHIATMHINSEQMPEPVKRETIQDGEGNLRSAVRDLGLPPLTNPSLQIIAILQGLSNPFKKGLDLIRVKVQGSTLHIRHDGTTNGTSNLIKTLQKRIASQSAKDEIEYITIVRLSTYDETRFVDEFWDYLVSLCHCEGIYWGYKLDRAVVTEDGLPASYPSQVLCGNLPAPYLPWMRQKDGTRKSHPFKSWFTSDKERESILTIFILQDADFQRTMVNNFFSLTPQSPNHDILVQGDGENNPGLFRFHVTVGKIPGIQAPVVPTGSKFQICRVIDEQLSEQGMIDTSVVAVQDDLGIKSDFVLEVNFPNRVLPWGPEFKHGASFTVQLRMLINTTAAYRKLVAIKEFSNNATPCLKELYNGGHMRKTYQPSSKYHEALEILRETDKRAHKAHMAWQKHIKLNQLQEQGMAEGLSSKGPASFTLGPPGTGKSEVAINAGLYVGQLGCSVLIAAPTKAAGKANAKKLASSLKHVDKMFKVVGVYFPTWSESMDRLHESVSDMPKRITEPIDDAFEELQTWKHVVAWASQTEQEDEQAASFLATFRKLESRIAASVAELEQFKKDFKALATNFLFRSDIKLIVISTCNNSACFAEMKLKFSLIEIDEAAVGDEADTMVVLQLPHDALLFLGDHLQLPPVIISKGYVEVYDQLAVTFFERTLEHSSQARTLLKISYRFGTQLADPIGIFGGYEGLASGGEQSSEFYKRFMQWWSAKHNPYARNMRRPPPDSLATSNIYKGARHRICFSIKNAFSSNPGSSLSTVNYANIKAGIEVIDNMMKRGEGITYQDLQIVCPFAAQADLWKAQLDIQLPGSGISVVTIGKSQGSEAKWVLFDATIANKSLASFLGFLKIWNRPNVAMSRPRDVLCILLNVEPMRELLDDLYSQSRQWALFLLDILDLGDICDIEGSPVLPKSREEFMRGPEHWTDVQSQPKQKAQKVRQAPSLYTTTGIDGFSDLERKYLIELRYLREKCAANVKGILEAEKQWEKERAARTEDEMANVMMGLEIMPLEDEDEDEEMKN